MNENHVDLVEMSAADMLAFVADMYDQTPDAAQYLFQLDFVDGNGNPRTMNMVPDDIQPQEVMTNKEMH